MYVAVLRFVQNACTNQVLTDINTITYRNIVLKQVAVCWCNRDMVMQMFHVKQNRKGGGETFLWFLCFGYGVL